MDHPVGTREQTSQEAQPARYTPGPLVWLAFFVLVIYPLSFGPAVHLYHAVPPLRKPIETFYAPLILLTENCPPVASWGLLAKFATKFLFFATPSDSSTYAGFLTVFCRFLAKSCKGI